MQHSQVASQNSMNYQKVTQSERELSLRLRVITYCPYSDISTIRRFAASFRAFRLLWNASNTKQLTWPPPNSTTVRDLSLPPAERGTPLRNIPFQASYFNFTHAYIMTSETNQSFPHCECLRVSTVAFSDTGANAASTVRTHTHQHLNHYPWIVSW